MVYAHAPERGIARSSLRENRAAPLLGASVHLDGYGGRSAPQQQRRNGQADGRRLDGLLQPKPETGEKAIVVIASADAERRRRWSQPLREAFAVCEVADRTALEQIAATLKPNILLLDLALPRLGRIGGLSDIQRLSPSTKILALTDIPVEAEGVFALKAGAKGYFPRTMDPARLKKAVAAVQKGEIWAARKLIAGLMAELLSLSGSRDGNLQERLDPRLERLTARQRMIADLIGEGACNKEIASRLKITERTVKAHLTEAFRHAGVSDRLQFALLLRGSSGTPSTAIHSVRAQPGHYSGENEAAAELCAAV